MEAASTVVIKVKYGHTLRRFSAGIGDEGINLSIHGLKEKICLLFAFSPETQLLLTYIDEDGDVVTLVDDEDIRDMVKQALNPLRITVRLPVDQQINDSSGISTPLRSPKVPQNPMSDFSEILRNVHEPLFDELVKLSTDLASKPLFSTPHKEKPSQDLNSALSQIAKTVQEPLFETLVKLSADLASKASTSAPGVADLVHYLSKVSFAYLDQLSDSQHQVKPSAQSGVSESSTTETNAVGQCVDDVDVGSNQSLTKLQPEGAKENNEVMCGNLEKASSQLPEMDAIASVVDSKTTDVGDKENVKSSKECQSNEKRHSITDHPPTVANNDLLTQSASDNRSALANSIPTKKKVIDPRKPYSSKDVASMDAPQFGKEGSLSCSRGKNAFLNSLTSFVFPTSSSMGSLSGPGSVYECPFSGLPVVVTPAASSRPVSQSSLCKRSRSQNESSGTIHRDVCCDSCGVHPIAGPRFKSKVEANYDLCVICFTKKGNDADYIRMDSPSVRRGIKVQPSAFKLDSRFIRDVNIVDGTIMAPSTPFTKIWRMWNNGTALWPEKTQLVWIGGDVLSNELVLEIEIPKGGLPVNQELDIAVNFTAPELPGRYISYWRMASPSGQKFGQRFWALIQVHASLTETQRGSLENLNLNLPPIGCDPEKNYCEDGQTRPDNSEMTVELVKPVVDLKPDVEHEMKFPINDNLLVGSRMSNKDASAGSSSLNPMLDLNDGSAVFSSTTPPPSPAANTQVSGTELLENVEVEKELLMKLNRMGLKNADLNKEILRINHYNLEKTVDDLSAAGEWDHILDELQEMGFHDREMNRMLLKKNNGSIKRIVMELIAAEHLRMS